MKRISILLVLGLAARSLLGQAVITPSKPIAPVATAPGSWMYYAGQWSAGTPYAKQQVTAYQGSTWISLLNNNLGNAPYTGSAFWTAFGGGGGGENGAVSSVFGRTGTVTAANGDYTTDQITEATAKFFTAGRAQAALAGMYQTPITAYSTISGLSGYPSTWTPAAHVHAAADVTSGTFDAARIPALSYQAPLTNYSTISGLTGYPSTFPPTTATNTRTLAVTDLAPVAADDGLILVVDPATAVHLTRVSCGVQGTTSVVVNLVKGGASLIADMTATAGDANTVVVTTWANGSSQCGGTSSCAVAAHVPVTMHIGAISGTPTALNCSLDYTVD